MLTRKSPGGADYRANRGRYCIASGPRVDARTSPGASSTVDSISLAAISPARHLAALARKRLRASSTVTLRGKQK